MIREKQRVLVEGVNMVYRHVRKSQRNPQGGRVQKEAPIHISNVMPLDPKADRGVRVRFVKPKGAGVSVRKATCGDGAGQQRGRCWATCGTPATSARAGVSDGALTSKNIDRRSQPALREELGRGNPMSLPKVEKIVVSMGLGKAVQESTNKARENKRFGEAEAALATVTRAEAPKCARRARASRTSSCGRAMTSG